MALVDIVVPAIDEISGISTARKAISVLQPFVGSATVVVDGCSEDVSVVNGAINVVRTSGLKGSYKSRNIGAAVGSCPILLFLDDGVDLEIDAPFEPSVRGIVGANVGFRNLAQDSWGHWYACNAFPVDRFLSVFGFLPTICLFVPRGIFDRLNGFDETFFSSGDVDFCRRAEGISSIEISSRVMAYTSLRTEGQIKKKIDRQVFGQVYRLRKRSRVLGGRFHTLLRAAANLTMLSGLNDFQVGSKPWFGCAVINIRINLIKSGILLRSIFMSNARVAAMQRKANQEEVGDAAVKAS